MPSYLPVVLTVIAVILTVVLSVVGIQIIMVLFEVKRTLKKVNDTVDEAELKLSSILAPLENLGGIASGLKTGMEVFKSFTGMMGKDDAEEADME